MSTPILLVDADEPTLTFLADQLSADGYETEIAPSATAAHDLATEHPPKAVLLGDIGGRNATTALLDDIRSDMPPFDSATAVLVLTEHRSPHDTLRALEHGADDVLAKPVDYRELRARLIAVQRRGERRPGGLIRVRDLQIDTRARDVRLAGTHIDVTRMEFKLLSELAHDPYRVFTKRELIQDLWGYPAECSTRTLDSHACRLRQKLTVDGDRSWIRNEWGVGYALTEAGSELGRAPTEKI